MLSVVSSDWVSVSSWMNADAGVDGKGRVPSWFCHLPAVTLDNYVCSLLLSFLAYKIKMLTIKLNSQGGYC